MKILPLICLAFILRPIVAIDIDDITISNCTIGSHCDDTINTGFGSSNTSEKVDDSVIGPIATENNTINVNATTDKPQIIESSSPTTTIAKAGSTLITTERSIEANTKNQSIACACDVTESSCDPDCCCDADCDGSQSAFSKHSHHQPKIYDSRYCYTRNFIQRNNTQFILERLASNLFCIAYDNLPPIYGIKNDPNIKDLKAFEDAKHATNPNKYSWDLNALVIPLEFNASSQYHKSDGLWRYQNNMITLIELPQSGFTGECKLEKILKYREPSEWKCMQTDLSNNNKYLFSSAYDNFTVISSPHLFNLSYIITGNHTCPNNICVPVKTFYCMDSENLCNGTKSPEQSCENSVCKNIIKRVRYTLTLNGTCGIRSIEIRFDLVNASQSFYQRFEVNFDENYATTENISATSESPGYIFGDPIITGILVRNNTSNVITERINVGESDFYLTVPLSRHNGDCDTRERYVVRFGEDVRLRCGVKLATDAFSSDSCVALQNQTLSHLLDDTLYNLTDIDKYNTFVSKMGNISSRDTLNWTRILLNRIARNVVTGQIYNDRIRCSGLLTSFNIDVLYIILPKSESPGSFKIAAVSVTFNEPMDVTWPKCIEPNCTDVLTINLLSLVSFTDISTPSMYYYAGGPNLDISLPYDFFYPFMSGSNNARPINLLIQSVATFITFNLLKFS